MKREWRVKRLIAPRSDGMRRWDRAYQLLLEWEAGTPAAERTGQKRGETVEGKSDDQ